MKPIVEFRTNSPLTEEQYTEIDTAIKTAALSQMKARRIMPTTGPFGFGKEAISFNKLSQMSDAQISYSWKVDANQDIVNLSPTVLPIPVLSKSFRINARDLEASRTYGTPLDTQNAKSAGYVVAKKEDELAFMGYKPDGVNYDIKGLYPSAGNSYTTSKDFGTATNIPDAINGALAKFYEDDIDGPFNLGLNPVQFAETNVLIANGGGKSWRQWIEETIGGQVYMTSAITAGTGLMTTAGDRGFFDLALGVDLVSRAEQLGLDEGYDLFAVAMETVVPRVFVPEAICALTQI
jgi:uncharacterized linocin/CFP29 family protein